MGNESEHRAGEETIGVYQIPGLGIIEIMHNNGSSSHGPYYARVKNYDENGKFQSTYSTCDSETEKEVRIKIIDEVEGVLRIKRSKLEGQAEIITASLMKMSISQRAQVLDAFGDLSRNAQEG
jgi:hypothetical protein